MEEYTDNQKCEHKWNKTPEQFAVQATEWHRDGSAPPENFYISKYSVHYWDIAECENCGEKKLLSSVFDRDGEPKIPDMEFTWLSLFITQMNLEEGHIEQKKALINDSLDQMHWEYFPYVTLHNPGDNYFSISYKDNQFLRYDWDFEDALSMFKQMNKRAMEYLSPGHMEALNEKLEQFDSLKADYRTLMEIATQAGIDTQLKSELDELSRQFKKLSEELNGLL